MENEKKTNVKNIVLAIIKFIEYIIMVIVVFLSVVIIVQRISNNEEAFLGFRVFKVETGSMIPKYNIADVILVKEKDISKIKVGDDLVYHGEAAATRGKVITHQVIEIGTDSQGERVFYTKGIANKKKDPVVYPSQIIGVVEQKLHSLSFIMNLFLNRYTLYFIIILPLTIYIFINALYGKEKKVRKEIRQRNKKIHDRLEKERKKQQAREEKMAQRRLGMRKIERLGNKTTNSKVEEKSDKKENKTTEVNKEENKNTQTKEKSKKNKSKKK